MAAHFQALAIRRELLANDRGDARYVEDVATSLQRIADLYRPDDPVKALAFYLAAADSRSWLLDHASNKNQAQANLVSVQKLIEATRSLIDKDRLDALAGSWWNAMISQTEQDFARSRSPIDEDIAACWSGVTAYVQSLVGPINAAPAVAR
jgi:hypothetical protein